MVERNEWFAVDKEGLARLLADRPWVAVFELVQNAWDTGAKRVDLWLTPHEGRRARYTLTVTDDDPDGFANLTHAYTFYARSEKLDDPTKRGRWNEGEKKTLAICDWARVQSTKGIVRFNEDGTRTEGKDKRPEGTEFRASIRMTKAQAQEALQMAFTLIPPQGVETFINGELLPTRECIGQYEAPLETVVVDPETDTAVRRVRRSVVKLYEPVGDEIGTVYELGIPVVESGDRFHYDVCVAPSTRILRSDLRYVEAGSVEPGTTLIGFDEERSPHRRRFRSAEVKDVHRVRKPCYRLTFDDGTQIICSSDHQWLCLRHGSDEGHGRTSRWLTTESMIPTVGKRPGSVVAKPIDVWESDDTSAATGYLAAAFDGEGCFFQTPHSKPGGSRTMLEFTQVDNPMLDHVRDLLDQRGVTYRETTTHVEDNPRWKPVFHLQISVRSEILRLLGQIRPVRLLPKFNVDLLGTMPTRRGIRLIKKEFLGTRTVVAIETSTHTFIAEGLASHNCAKVPLSRDRDNVPPKYLRVLRAEAANTLHALLTKEDTTTTWVKEALASPEIEDSAIQAIVVKRFGEKAVTFDPSDPEANQRAAAQGYAVIPGRSLSREEWISVRRTALLPPAGQVTPSNKALFSSLDEPGAEPPLSGEAFTPGMERVADYAKRLAKELLGRDIEVFVYRRLVTTGRSADAAYGHGKLCLSLQGLGHKWFNEPTPTEVDALLIHEFGHEFEGNHLSERYHDVLCNLGAQLRNIGIRL